ncbi:MAG: nitrous oxide-stimulated promoter family protein [Peptococcaceae bacterium]|nr:nitrous oxide-stimulated promoter family protein [Peptococcaceae bacterium]
MTDRLSSMCRVLEHAAICPVGFVGETHPCYTIIMSKKVPQKAKDTKLVAHFTEWYCAAHHGSNPRVVLESQGVLKGIYGKRIPILCAECANYVRCVETRTEKCPKDPKPFCTVCDIKCYKPEMAEYARKIMRYSGPRSLFSRYWRQAVRHIVESRRSHKKTAP